jgi:F0F1-type ATP synthase membrane subunit c/vacuolar-type H+-ATPase subunit K
MLIFIIVIFILAVGLLTFAFVVPKITDGLSDAGLNESTQGKNAIDELADLGANGLQKGFFFIFVGLIASTMITSFFALTHRAFLFLYIIILGLTLFVGTYFGNAFEQFAKSPALASTLQDQGFISIVMENIVLITLVTGALSMILIFAKFVRQNQQGGPM